MSRSKLTIYITDEVVKEKIKMRAAELAISVGEYLEALATEDIDKVKPDFVVFSETKNKKKKKKEGDKKKEGNKKKEGDKKKKSNDKDKKSSKKDK